MAELVVVGFDNVTEADRALMELARLQKDYLIDLEDAVVAIRQPDEKVNLKQSINLVGIGAASGGLSGALWGSGSRRSGAENWRHRSCPKSRPFPIQDSQRGAQPRFGR
jgi:hypothetical protein